MTRRPALLACALAVALALAGCSRISLSGPGTSPTPTATPSGSPSCAEPATDLRPPDGGVWIGASVQWARETAAAYADRLGHDPAVLVSFADLPMSATDEANVSAAVDQARGLGSMLLLTLEPSKGLAPVTDEVAERTARLIDGYTRSGVPVLVRFGHEMNGSWYAWGQQPKAYVAAFRRMAAAVHAQAPGAAMMWAPNAGQGYPFTGGRYAAKPGTAAYRALDTNHDGTLGEADDPYAPYWPGADAVDWVGMSDYHWGTKYPWGQNEVPVAGKFVGQLRGSYVDPAHPHQHVPDFYRLYAERYDKPLSVTETAALYVPGAGGAAELAVKRGWWRQVFAADLPSRLPLLANINWFEQDKREAEVHARVDWTTTTDDTIRAAYVADLPSWARWGQDVPHCAG